MRQGLKRSLLSQYVLIIGIALVLLPLIFPIVSSLLLLTMMFRGDDGGRVVEERYRNAARLERMWHEAAAGLGGAADEAIDSKLRELKEAYPKADLFWVDAAGNTRLQLPDNRDIPAVWSPSYTVQFMKERFGGDPFTVVAFIGQERQEGFMVFALARANMKTSGERLWERESYSTVFLVGTLLILGLFLFVSLLFFYRIRKRLVRLQTAMTAPGASGIPGTIEVLNRDEIGRLESAFNDMIFKLEQSRAREAGEEALRRELIAKLSHDLRTPLTAIRSHAYSLRGESLSEKGLASVGLIERKIDYLGQMIENLFSYSLLSAGKYPYRPQRVDIARLTKTLLAGWYPVFEQAGFEVDPDLPDHAVYWEIDPEWLERVLDNYFQNVLRHARSGKYIGVAVSGQDGGAVVISDRGPGLGSESTEKGAGLGLSIARLMLKEMRLRGDVQTAATGTAIRIAPAASEPS